MKKIALIVPALMLVMAGCSKHDEASKGGSQVVAKVNGSEITVHQLNFALSKLGNLDQTQMKAASQKVLQQMVDMELLKQKSVEQKLDRDPNVLQVLEATKQQVLAQAYMQKLTAKQPSPSTVDIQKFYDTHPELFSERNIYGIHEFAVKDGTSHVSEIEAGINDAKAPEDVAKWLKDNHYDFNVSASRKAAEQLPLELLKQLNTLKVGDTLVVKSPQSLVLLFLAKIDRQPVALENAKPVIQQFLVNSGQQTLIKDEIANLRKTSKVEFMGDFANMILNADTATPDVSSAKPEAATPPATPPASQAAPTRNQAIEKGLSGL